ncbi:MAG TPA: hypothetical protein VMB91_03975 [Solirubrobacteraceae bacterium]|nr:hypothetical protein [Solirubrobacteraceae bacterium]
MRSLGGNGGARTARLICAALLAAMLVSAALATAALAGKPKGNPEFAEFAHCPVYTKKVTKCLVAHTTSGEFKLGKKTVHITSPITIQGGLTEKSFELVPPVGAEVLSKVPIEVPGGLTGIELLSLGGPNQDPFESALRGRSSGGPPRGCQARRRDGGGSVWFQHMLD